jgi:hypothetical protein
MTSEELLNYIRQRRADENINTNNTNEANDANNANDANETKDIFLSEKKMAFVTEALPPGGLSREEAVGHQVVVSVMGDADSENEDRSAPTRLVDHRHQLVSTGNWIRQSAVNYAKISIYPQINQMGQYNRFKIYYDINLKGTTQMMKFTSYLTSRPSEYESYSRKLWSDIEVWRYEEIAEAARQCNRNGYKMMIGRCSPNAGRRKSTNKMPNLPFTSTVLAFDPADDIWTAMVYHHDFFMDAVFPRQEWDESLEYWMKNWAIKNEATKEKTKKVPPFITYEYRSMI